MNNMEEVTRSIILAHCINAVSTTQPAKLDECVHMFRGVSKSVTRLGIPTVVLLSEDSTPQKTHMAESAPADLERALKALVTRGEVFYTMLRPHWALPALQWHLSP